MSFYQVPLEGVQIVTAEQAALLAGQLDSQPAVLQINNPPIAPLNVDQSYYVSLNGELYYPVAASDISGQVAVVPLDQQMDWVAVPVAQQQFAIQQLQPEVQVQSFPSSSTFGMVPTTSETSSVPIRQKKWQIRRPKTSKSKKALFETFETSSTPSPTLANSSPSSVRVISEGSVSPVVPGKSLDKPRRRRKKLAHEKVPRRMKRDYDEILSSHELLREFRKTMPKPRVKLTKRFKRQLLSDRYKKPVEEVMSESSEEDPGKYDEFFDRLEMLGEDADADSVQEDGSDVWEPKDTERDVQREESVQVLSDDEEDEIAVETVHAPESPKRMRSISESPKEPSVAEDEEEPEEHFDEEKSEQKRNASGDDDEEREGSDFFDDEEEQQFLEYFTNLVASSEHDLIS